MTVEVESNINTNSVIQIITPAVATDSLKMANTLLLEDCVSFQDCQEIRQERHHGYNDAIQDASEEIYVTL